MINLRKNKTATSKDMTKGYHTGEKRTKKDFVKAQVKEADNLKKQFAQGDKRNWY